MATQHRKTTPAADALTVMVIDVGGTHVKPQLEGQTEPLKIVSGPAMTARKMVTLVRKATAGWTYNAVSIGYPGPVVHDHPFHEPVNLGGGWVGFDFAKAFGCSVKIVNDAAMQALGSYEGGRMLFLGLGTGLGSAMIVEGIVQPLELAHLPYKKKTYEDYVGLRGLKKFGKKKWRREVEDVVNRLQTALEPDYVVLGGGNAKLLDKVTGELPKGCRLGVNENAFIGGVRLWKSPAAKAMPPRRP